MLNQPSSQSFDIPVNKPTPEVEIKNNADIESYRKEAQEFLQGMMPVLTTFSGDTSLTYKLGKGFFINMETGEISLDTSWFHTRGFTKKQILWALLHENSHFLDLKRDTKGIEENLKHILEQAKKTGDTMLRKWVSVAKDRPDVLKQLTKIQTIGKAKHQLRYIDYIAYGFHHTFFNITDDIFVNHLVERKAQMYTKNTPGGDEVYNLYKEKLFKEQDFTTQPRHLQYAYALLRTIMVPDEEVKVSDDVRKHLEAPLTLFGKSLHSLQWVHEIILPRKNKDTSATNRNALIRQTLEKQFLSLLEKDLDEWEPQLPEDQEKQKQEKQDQTGEEGEKGDEEQESSSEKDQDSEDNNKGLDQKGEDQSEENNENNSDENGEPSSSEEDTNPSSSPWNPFAKSYKQHKENTIDQIDEDAVEEYMKKKEEKDAQEEERKKAEAKITPEERAKMSQDMTIDAFAKEHNISDGIRDEYKKLLMETKPFVHDLGRFWLRLIHGKRHEIKRITEGHFKQGNTLDIQQVINEYAHVVKKQFTQMRPFQRDVIKELPADKPDQIVVRLVCDMSGSMDAAKLDIVRKCTMLILQSLDQFQTYLDLERRKNKTQLQVNSEVWVYGSSAHVAKEQSNTRISADEARMRVLEHLGGGGGSTANHKAFEAIAQGMTEKSKEDLRKQKRLELVIEITDGEPDSPETTAQAVEQLKNNHMIVKSFQIGEPGDAAKATFKNIWGDDGEVIGNELGNILPVMVQLFEEHLSIRI